jgi:CRP-like cAMP-binding protein
MNLVERMFALRQLSCFQFQTEFDLARIAEAVSEKRYDPGAPLCTAGQTLRRVYIVAAGTVETTSGKRMPNILGPASVLLNAPVKEALRAGPEGAHCLLLEKGIFFTIVYQCPSIIREILKADIFEVSISPEGDTER